MKKSHHIPFRTALLLPLLLGGCTSFDDFLGRPQEPLRTAPPPVSERPIQAPLLNNHYVLESPQQTVIGVPQVVLSNATDTLADLALAYGLGYDELLAANPDVDPWLPGEQTPMLLPTQYVCRRWRAKASC